MNEIKLRMWREWTDDKGAHYASGSFESWQSLMRPHRHELLAIWAKDLNALLSKFPEEVPYGRLHELYEQAETLRTLDSGTPWEVPFNRMRSLVQARDFDELRSFAAELRPDGKT